jgi:hypothetical protein
VPAEEQPRAVRRQRHGLHVPDRAKPPDLRTRVALVEVERREVIRPGPEAAVEPTACCGEVSRRLWSCDRAGWDLPRVQITRGRVNARHTLPRVPDAVGARDIAERATHEDRAFRRVEFQGSHLGAAAGVRTR